MTSLTHRKGAPPQLAALIPLVTDSVPSANGKKVYEGALNRFFEWYSRLEHPHTFAKALVNKYIQELLKTQKSPSTINQALTVIRRLADEAHDAQLLDTRTRDAIMRIKPLKRLGRRTGRWLSETEAASLIHKPDLNGLKGKRDRVLLGLLVECGLRREEAITLNVDQFQVRKNRHLFADVKGKGGRIRTVPVPAPCARRIQDWIDAAGLTEGRLLRRIGKNGKLAGDSLTAPGVYKAVREYAESMGLKIAPHDLRRTFAQLAHGKNARLEQIQHTLGHESIRTTEIYLGLQLDLDNAACDAFDLEQENK